MASRKTGITFEPVRRESTREKVHSAIRSAILDGRLRLGQRLTEISLAKDFGVSRAVVREALQELAHDGLVEQNAYRGSSVVSLTPEQVDEIISTRVLLEAEAVRLAVKSITAADVTYLEKLTRQIHDARTDPDATSELDLSFHEKLWELSGNGTLQKVLLQITAPLFAMGAIMRHAERTNRTPLRKTIQRSSHAALMEHIKSRNANKAATAIREHIEANWMLIRSHLEEYLQAESKPSTKLRNTTS
ncbi:GntR family transcriptional regulator [Edaphobacter albus]|uniref:GntR family transcriptional regulator n=1 Tax=Edaphobacter sp. 4G125 TaxID=2763071 RepID=UPI0016444D26|nr:GntR family transcriptional regulator [Edaphobacter sp. 4G125]QNI35749.1 GntR family transcriptional regulator [Edaphobacter sp. 4G125]